jgi:hypothetical protein
LLIIIIIYSLGWRSIKYNIHSVESYKKIHILLWSQASFTLTKLSHIIEIQRNISSIPYYPCWRASLFHKGFISEGYIRKSAPFILDNSKFNKISRDLNVSQCGSFLKIYQKTVGNRMLSRLIKTHILLL